MGISSGIGLMSGLDTEAIITATMNVERTPILLLQQKQANFSAKISSYGSLKSSLSGLQTAVTALKETDNFDPSYSASSSNKDILTVETSSEATGGTYSLKVAQLATSEQMAGNIYSDTTDTVGSGILHFKVGDGEKQSVTIDDSNKSLADIATQINEADTDISASVLKVGENDYRLTLTAKNTGENIDFTYQEAGFTFETTSQASESSGETMESQAFDSDTSELGITGTLSLNDNDDITLDGSESLTEIRDSINTIANMNASIEQDAETGKYSLKINNTNANENIGLKFEDTDNTGGFSELIDPSKTQLAKQALININGIDVTRNDNSISDLITGVTIDLVEADAEKIVTVNVTGNYNTPSEKLGKFVSAYNEAIKTIDSMQSYNSETGAAGNLIGDSTTNMLKSGLRRMMFSSVEGIDSSVNSMSNLGVTFEDSGQLSYESSTFTAAMENNKEDITNFFTQATTSNEGFAVGLDSFLDGYLDSRDGVLAAKETGYNNSIKRIDTNIESIERRLASRESNLRDQYNNLEQLMSSFMSTSSYLSNQLSVMSNMTSTFYK